MSNQSSPSPAPLTLGEDICFSMVAVAIECHQITEDTIRKEFFADELVQEIEENLRGHPFTSSIIFDTLTANPDAVQHGLKLFKQYLETAKHTLIDTKRGTANGTVMLNAFLDQEAGSRAYRIAFMESADISDIRASSAENLIESADRTSHNFLSRKNNRRAS